MVNSLPIPVPVCTECFSTDIQLGGTSFADGEEKKVDLRGLGQSQMGFCNQCKGYRDYDYMTPYEARKRLLMEGR